MELNIRIPLADRDKETDTYVTFSLLVEAGCGEEEIIAYLDWTRRIWKGGFTNIVSYPVSGIN